MKSKVEFNKSETLKNLARSFASECMEGAKYQFIAQQCVAQKLNYLQMVFKTLAKHEMSHAKVFWQLIHQNYNGDIIENYLWHNTRNGNLIVNLRKIKVIL